MRAINVLLLRHRHSLILPGESGIERMQLQFCHDESLPRAQLDAFRKCIFPLVTWKMFLLDNHKIAQATWRYLAVLKVEFQGEIITKKESHFSEESVHCKLQNCGLSKKKKEKKEKTDQASIWHWISCDCSQRDLMGYPDGIQLSRWLVSGALRCMPWIHTTLFCAYTVSDARGVRCGEIANRMPCRVRVPPAERVDSIRVIYCFSVVRLLR